MPNSEMENITRLISRKTVTLTGADWDFVVATLQESAANCFRCERKGCLVCKATNGVAATIQKQLLS